MTSTIVLHVGDVRDIVATLPDNAFDLLVTSPPFLALRSYLPADHPEKHREIGSEPTPATFLDTLYGLTAEWGRLIPEWGSICVELGDTMAGSGGAGGDYGPDGMRGDQQKFKGSALKDRKNKVLRADGNRLQQGPGWPLAKSMCILPHLYAAGLAYGHNPLTGQESPAGQWRVRNVIAWARPNPPVGSLGKRNPHTRTGDQRFRMATSFITVACRGTGRYFDLDAVRTTPTVDPASYTGNGYTKGNPAGNAHLTAMPGNPAGAPPLDWHTDHLDGDWLWRLPTAPYKGAHYATFPLTLPRRMILAMCPQRVCTVCGWPSERIIQSERSLGPAVDPADQRRLDDARANGTAWLKNPTPASYMTSRREGVGTTVITLGWTNCDCESTWTTTSTTSFSTTSYDLSTNSDTSSESTMRKATEPKSGTESAASSSSNWRTGHVLDPFAGSGTTAVAAALEHRNCTLIDLDPRNVELVDRRIHERLNVVRQIASHPKPRTLDEGRAGRTPPRPARANGRSGNPPAPRPIYTCMTWIVDGEKIRKPTPKPPAKGQAPLFVLEVA